MFSSVSFGWPMWQSTWFTACTAHFAWSTSFNLFLLAFYKCVSILLTSRPLYTRSWVASTEPRPTFLRLNSTQQTRMNPLHTFLRDGDAVRVARPPVHVWIVDRLHHDHHVVPHLYDALVDVLPQVPCARETPMRQLSPHFATPFLRGWACPTAHLCWA